ncbi:MAG: hypothetical protein H0W83_09095 [Planctomycetes bacterium]|nr:hypothetical protein [Planctomycetota bacterium]
MQIVDRLVAACGGRRLAAGRPGIGWLVVEVVPAAIWSSITGAMSMEFYYFVAFLTLLGADNATLAWLPLMVFAGGVFQAALILRRPPRDARRHSIAHTITARCCWMLTVLWPLAALWLGLASHWIFIGVFAAVFATHLINSAAITTFITWTQAAVPAEHRGTFFAMRNLLSFAAVAMILYTLSWILPKGTSAVDPQQLPRLMWLLGGATLVGILGVIPLLRTPALPIASTPISYPPLVPHLRGNGRLVRLIIFMMLVMVAMAASTTYQPKLFIQAGVEPSMMAAWQGKGMYPGMIAGILAAGWCMPRIGGARAVLVAHLLVMGSEAAMLGLAPDRITWMLPMVLTVSGVAKGAWSVAYISCLHEVMPRGDPRFLAVLHAAASFAGMVMALTLSQAVPMIEGWLSAHPGAPSLAWCMVGLGVAVRMLSTPLLSMRPAPQRDLTAVQTSS